MSKKLVKKASKFRDEIPELEGLLIGKLDGTKLWADTLTDLNHEFILSSASVVVRAVRKVSESMKKKDVEQVDVELDGGYASIVVTKKALVVGFVGDDARAQLAIIKNNLKTFAKEIQSAL